MRQGCCTGRAFDCFQNPPKTKGVGDLGAALKQKMRFPAFIFRKSMLKCLRNLKKKKKKITSVNVLMPEILRRAEGEK